MFCGEDNIESLLMDADWFVFSFTPNNFLELELDEPVSSRSNSYIVKKPSNPNELKHKGIQSHVKNTLEDYKNSLRKNKSKCGVHLFWELPNMRF